MTIDPALVSTFVAAAIKIAEAAPGVLAVLFGTRTDEEALDHARATLSAVQPLGERLDAVTEANKKALADRMRQLEETRRTTLPAPEPAVEPIDGPDSLDGSTAGVDPDDDLG